jgi:hypothetical protein
VAATTKFARFGSYAFGESFAINHCAACISGLVPAMPLCLTKNIRFSFPERILFQFSL